MTNKGKKFMDLDQLKVFFLIELDKRFEFIKEEFRSVKEQLKTMNNRMDKMDNRIEKMDYKLDYVYQSLVDSGLIKPFAKTNSPKQITERGTKLLDKHKVDSYLQENCLLLKDEKLKKKKDSYIFVKCLDWVKTDGKEKVAEIRLDNNILEEQCIELLALLILEKIKK